MQRAALLALPILAACSPHPQGKPEQALAQTSHATDLVTLPIDYVWHNDPRCFVGHENETIDPRRLTGTFAPSEQLMNAQPRFSPAKRMHGFLTYTWEGSNIVEARRHENADAISWQHRWQARVSDYGSAWPEDSAAQDTTQARTYWIDFIGREALCNRTRYSEDPGSVTGNLGNEVTIDRIVSWQRI